MVRRHWIVGTFFLLFASLAFGQGGANAVPSTTELKAAITVAEDNTDMAEEQRNQLLDSYRRAEGFLKTRDEAAQKRANFADARANASAQAAAIQKQLEKDMAAYEGKSPSPPVGVKRAELEQLIQADKAELSALESRGAALTEALAGESGRADIVRGELTELRSQKDQLGAPAAPESEAPVFTTARLWLVAAQSASIDTRIAALEEELLSQPMRQELMQEQQDRAAFDILRLRNRIKVFEQALGTLRQEEAAEALTAAASAQEAVADKHPLIQELAQSNTVLSAELTALAAELEKVKERESLASEEAQRFENDLQSIQRKLEVLGMSEALGRVLREQKLRLPKPLYSTADIKQRDKLISDSSLRQLQYEDERRRLRSLSAYVNELVKDLPEAEAEPIRDDLRELARMRRDLIGRAIESEASFLRALGNLDFSIRRVETAAGDYRDFISERLLWIRSSNPFSLETVKELPGDLMRLFSPKQWWSALSVLPTAMLSSVLYPVLLLAVILLWRYFRRLLELLEKSYDKVGNVAEDKFSYSLKALLVTFLLALPLPLLMFTVGLALEGATPGNPFGSAVAVALMRISYYYLGLEFLRLLLIDRGVLRHHFLWGHAAVRGVRMQMLALQVVFLPAMFIAILLDRSNTQEVLGALTSIAVIVALLAMARFFAGMPNIMQGRLDKFIRMNSSQRRSLLGRGLRYFLVAVPCVLSLLIVLGYTHTAVEFLVLLLQTNALFALLLLVHELGLRWLRIMRQRVIETERQAALAAAEEAAEGDEQEYVEDFDEPDPEALDQAGRKLLNVVVGVSGLLGVWVAWADVLPALGILDSVQLWNTTELVGGVETAVPVTLTDIAQGLLVAFVGYVAIQRVPALLELFLRQSIDLAPGTVYAGVTLLRYTLMAVFLVIVLGMFGADWGQIQWAVAALSVGIGFGLQEIVANFISGIILLFEQPIRVGDTITVGETSGVVTKIRMRATTVRDWDGRELLVPNKEFITGRLLNWSLSDTQTRVIIEIGIAYGSDVPRAMKLALDVAKENPEILEDPAPFITFDSFGDNSLLLRLRAYLPSVDNRLSVSSQLREAVNEKYNEAGIVIAFPQRDVHLNTESPLEIMIQNSGGGGLPAD